MALVCTRSGQPGKETGMCLHADTASISIKQVKTAQRLCREILSDRRSTTKPIQIQ